MKEVDFDLLQKDRNSLLLDCRREMMGVVNLESCEGKGLVHIWYGESLAEATDKENCELTDELDFPVQTRPEVGKAFPLRPSARRGSRSDQPESTARIRAAGAERKIFLFG